MKKFAWVFIAVIGLFSCEPNNPFQQAPAYDFEGNLAKDRLTIDAFLDTAQIDSIYRIHDSTGVVIIVQEEGAGSRPVNNTVIYADYTGYLVADGSVFDTSIEQVARDNDIFVENRRYVPFSFVLLSGPGSGVIQGWDIAFRRMRPGSKFVIVIPAPYGYQNQEGRDRIPPNSVLAFEIDFLGTD